jgi:hypothetical protein
VSVRRVGAPVGEGIPPKLRLVRRRSRVLVKRSPGTRLASLALVSAICVGGLVFGVLLEQVILAQSAFKLARIRRQIAAADATNQELLLRMTRLESPRRLERYARTRLGMVGPRRVEYLVADLGRARDGLPFAMPWRRPSRAAHALGAGATGPGAP